jgi:hypothetical protein
MNMRESQEKGSSTTTVVYQSFIGNLHIGADTVIS